MLLLFIGFWSLHIGDLCGGDRGDGWCDRGDGYGFGWPRLASHCSRFPRSEASPWIRNPPNLGEQSVCLALGLRGLMVMMQGGDEDLDRGG